MKYIHLTYLKSRQGQSMVEYGLVFAAIVALTVVGATVLVQGRASLETHRDKAVQRILGSAGGGGP